MGDGAYKAVGKAALTPLVFHALSLLFGFILTRQWDNTLIISFWLSTSTLAPLGPSSYVPLLSTMALHCSLGFGLGLLRSLTGGVVDELACCIIYNSSIFLWVVNKSTLEASYLVYSPCFCCAKSTLSNIDLRLDFWGRVACWGKGGLWNPGGIGLALAWGKGRGLTL